MGLDVVVRASAPLDLVWSTLLDVEQWPEWTTSMVAVERLDSGPLVVGSRARIKQPRRRLMTWTVNTLDLHQRFTWSTHSPGLTMVADHILRDCGYGTIEIHLSVEQSGALSRPLRRLTHALALRAVTAEANGLKARVEMGATS